MRVTVLLLAWTLINLTSDSSVACGQLPAAGARLPQGTRFLRDLPYVSEGHARQKLDLYVPQTDGPRPLIVWIHGGGWQGGDKAGSPALPLLRGGRYVVASVNYRLSSDAPFPAQIEDCKAAVRWLRAHADEYSIDRTRIGVWGASAGGHLVALLGTTQDAKDFDVGENLDQSSGVQCVCDFFGPTDLNLYGRSRPGDTLSKLIGGPIQDHPDEVTQANPIHFVTRGDPPFLIMHGDQDTLVPLEHSEHLEQALREAGIPVTLTVVPGAGHGFGGKEIMEQITAFFDEHLSPQATVPDGAGPAATR